MTEGVKARYWGSQGDGNVRCQLCPHACRIPEGGRGVCGIRVNKGGELVAAAYGIYHAVHLDPIEKKPLNHFYPGSRILSLGSIGCNLTCLHCQNWSLSRERPEGMEAYYLPPDILIDRAMDRGSIGVAFTYNEPTINFEYIMDVSPALRRKGAKVVHVTNGHLDTGPWKELMEETDGANIDVKGFTEEFYGSLGDAYLETPRTYITRDKLPVNIYFKMLMNEYARRGVLGGNILYNLFYELRMPTFDAELFDFGYRLPLELRINQDLYRFTFSRLFPALSQVRREFLNLPVHAADYRIWLKIMEFKISTVLKRGPAGFLIRMVPRWNRPNYVDYASWFRQELRKELSSFLEEMVTVDQGVFKRISIDEIAREHFEGKADHSDILWQVINLEYIYRNFII